MKHPDVPKTGPEKKLTTKYKKRLQSTETFEELQQLARSFKSDLAVFLQKNRRYSFMLLLFTTFSIAQRSIVASGNDTYTVGETFPIMQQVDMIVEVTLSIPKKKELQQY